MKFKIMRFIIILLVLSISQYIYSENHQILKTSKNPIHGHLDLKLKKDLIVGEEAPGPYFFASVKGIEVSDKYIYVLDSKMAKVKVYDLKGKFIREIGRKGEGPGEFIIPVNFCLSDNRDIYIYDLQRRRMSVFNSEGRYKRDFIVEKPLPGKFYVDEKNYIYTTFEESASEKFLNREINFAKINEKGEVKKIFYKIFRIKLIPFNREGMKGNLYYEHPS